MKVILLSDVPNLGKKNDIVDVNDGYAKNFLLKKKLAVQENAASLNKLNQNLENIKQEHEKEVYEAQLLKQKIESLNPCFYLKANHGNAFGKVSAKELIDVVNEKEKLINKYMLEEKEWGLGPHKIRVNVHKEVVATLSINVREKE